MSDLAAPSDKVFLYLEWLAVRGREIALRPLADHIALIRAREDHHAWVLLTQEALRRAFKDDELAERFTQPRRAVVSFETDAHAQFEQFRAKVTAQLGVLDEAIALVRAALARRARG